MKNSAIALNFGTFVTKESRTVNCPIYWGLENIQGVLYEVMCYLAIACIWVLVLSITVESWLGAVGWRVLVVVVAVVVWRVAAIRAIIVFIIH